MKTLADGSMVLARTYYYLLDWNESNEWKYINQTFSKNKLCDLTKDEYKQLFEYTTLFDKNLLQTSIEIQKHEN